MRVVVTVGMGPHPFDRLVAACVPLCAEHELFMQIGASAVVPPCPHARHLAPAALAAHIAAADVVITHAGNTVREIQRLGRVPIAVARERRFGEMSNDHQVEYLVAEAGPVVAVWDVATLPEAVRAHPAAERLLRLRPLPPPPDPERLADRLDAIMLVNPFEGRAERRYAWAWEVLRDRTGRHLDVGANDGAFLAGLGATTALRCTGVDAHPGYVAACRAAHPTLDVAWVAPSAPLPFPDGSFASVSLLDVLEHVPDEARCLAEVRRVLVPGGLLVLTVPARHAFSFLDPDNAKYRLPRLHRAVYAARFGAAIYEARFVDLADGLRGDIAANRTEHTNYRPAALRALVEGAGFTIERTEGAHLFWRWFQVPALLGGRRTRAAMERLIRWDGRAFRQANAHLVARA